MNAAVFLDRDNTLIQNDGDLGDPEQVKLVQGAASAIASLRGLGYKIVVVSNQGGVARGKFTEADVERVNQRINELVKINSGATIDRFYFCPFHPDATVDRYRADHPWRKPKPGMLLQAAKDLEIDPAQSWMIGDQMRDVEAGAAAGARTILLREDAEELNPLRREELASKAAGAVFAARNLIEAVRIIAQQRKPETPEEARARQRSDRIREISQAARNVPPLREVEPIKPVTPARPPEPIVPPSPPRAEAPEMPSVSQPPVPPASLPEPASEGEILRQILHELRHQRAQRGDFSYFKGLALIFQLIAVLCIGGALAMGGESHDVFLRWIALGIVVQLMAIAMLFFGR